MFLCLLFKILDEEITPTMQKLQEVGELQSQNFSAVIEIWWKEWHILHSAFHILVIIVLFS